MFHKEFIVHELLHLKVPNHGRLFKAPLRAYLGSDLGALYEGNLWKKGRLMRDDFPRAVVELLAKRVGQRCSNPGCAQLTSGPHTDNNKAVNVGVAAHITAASPGGPRYDLSLTPEQRSNIENGIWLCQTCAKLVDNDMARYTVTVLRKWQVDAEATALKELETRGSATGRADDTDDHSIRFTADEWRVWRERGNLPGDGVRIISGWKRGDVRYSCTLRFRNGLHVEDQIRVLRIEFRQGDSIVLSDEYPFEDDLLVLPPMKWTALEVCYGLHENAVYENADSMWFSAETVGDKQQFAWRVADLTVRLADLSRRISWRFVGVPKSQSRFIYC